MIPHERSAEDAERVRTVAGEVGGSARTGRSRERCSDRLRDWESGLSVLAFSAMTLRVEVGL